MEYLSKAYTYFSLSGENLDSNDFIEKVNITPTKMGEDRFGVKFLEYKVEAADANEGLDKAIESLVRNLSLKAKEINRYASQRDLYIKIFVVIEGKDNENNGVFFNKEFIQLLFEMSAEIEIEIYNA
jgi:hypothetical protein